MSTIKTYSELIKLPTFIERFRYLKLSGIVGEQTFGSERWLNQYFYTSREWRDFRKRIIARDLGRDLAMINEDIGGPITIHHINQVTVDDLVRHSPALFDPENVVCASSNTHKAIHYGDETMLNNILVIRRPNDTCPWLN